MRLTVPQILQLFLNGYQAIKAGDPAAKIIAPSISGYLVAPSRARPELLDLGTFLDFAAGQHLRLDAIAWHETRSSYVPTAEHRPEAIAAHVAQVRNMIAARPALGSPQIFVNEYMHESNVDLPGWRVGYIAALEAANVDEADMTCLLPTPDGGGCNAGSLDGLLADDGSTPRAPYWVQLAYATMTGTRAATWSSVPHLSAFATRASAVGPVQVLLGRHQSCTPAVNPLCPDPESATPGPVNLTLVVKVPGGNRTAVAIVQRIPNQSGGVLLPPTPRTLTVAVRGGQALIPIPSFADGEAYSVTVT